MEVLQGERGFKGQRRIQFGRDRGGTFQRPVHLGRGRARILEMLAAIALNERRPLVERQCRQFGAGELAQQGGAGGAERVAEGLDPVAVAHFQKELTAQADFLAGEQLGQAKAIVRQPAHGLPRGGGDLGNRQATEMQALGARESVAGIILVGTEADPFFELG